MESDRRPGARRLPRWEPDQDGRVGQARQARSDGVRRVRVMSNWTAAALLAATGAGTVALASHAFSAGTTATTTTTANAPGTAGAHGTSGPGVSGPVVTSGGSGATAAPATKVVNGKIVVTRPSAPASWHDN